MMDTIFHVHIDFDLHTAVQTGFTEAMTASSASTPDIDRALLTLWDHLFAHGEQRYEHAMKHGVELFDPTCQFGNFIWPHVASITFMAAPSPTTFVFAVTFADDETMPELLFTVVKEGDVFRVLDMPPYVS